MPAPEIENLLFKDIPESWFYYYTLDSIIGLFLKFLGNGAIQIDTKRGSYPPILIFDNREQLESFVTYVKTDTDNEKYLENGNYKNHPGRIEGNAVFISRMGELYDKWCKRKGGKCK